MKYRDAKFRIGNCRPERHRTRSGVRAAGVTLIELIVVVALIVIVMIAFGTILNQARRVTAGAQAAIRGNAAAKAIAQVIRRDLRRATQNGFLCITQDLNGRPRLLVTTVGPTPSLTGSCSSTAGLVQVGICDNDSPYIPDPNMRVLWRRGMVLASDGEDPDKTDPDILRDGLNNNIDLVALQRESRAVINVMIYSLFPQTAPETLTIPPDELGDVDELWQCLAANCSELSIMWTDGETSDPGNGEAPLNWYGVDYNEDSGYVSIWTDPAWTADPGLAPKDPEQIEYDGDPSIGEVAYRALWTRHNLDHWPKAIKVRFTLADESLPEEIRDVAYEVICPVGP